MGRARMKHVAWIVCLACGGLQGSPGAFAADGERSSTVDPAAASFHAANGLLNRGLFRLAVTEYEQFLTAHQSHPKSAVARYGLGVCRFRLQQHEKAIEQFRMIESASGFPYGAETHTMLGQSLIATGQYADAARSFENVVTNHAEHDLADDAAAGLVEARFRAAQFDKAATACQQFHTKWPSNELSGRVAYFGGRALMAGGKHGEAVAWFERVVARAADGTYAEHAAFLLARCHHQANAITQAIGAYRKVVAAAGGRFVADATVALAMLLRQSGQPQEAGSLLDGFLDSNMSHTLGTRAWYERGHVWMSLEKPGEAYRCFERAGKDGGFDLADAAAYWAGKAKLRTSDAKAAARLLGDAIRDFPESELLPHMHFDRGVALLRAGDRQKASGALEALRTRFPSHDLAADALYILATSAHEDRDFDSSGAYCAEFLKTYPTRAERPAVAFMAAENAFLTAEYERAARLFRSFVDDFESDERVVKARFRLGLTLHKLARTNEAENALDEAIRLGGDDPSFAPALLALGDISFERSEWKKAAKRLEQYLSVDGELAAADEALLKLGLARQRDGQHERALAAYDRLIGRFPSSVHLGQAWFEKGQALMALRRWDEAHRAFRDLDGVAGSERFAAFASQHLGAIAMRRGAYSEAAEHFGRVDTGGAGDNDLSASALLQQGRSLLADRNYAEAARVLGDFAQRFEDRNEAGEARAQQVIALARADQCERALKVADTVRGRHFDRLSASLQSSVLYESAWCWRASGRLHKAKETYRALVSTESTEELPLRGLYELGGLHEKAKEYDAAAAQYRRLFELGSADASLLPEDIGQILAYRLGVCEYQLGRYADAAKTLAQFLGDHPDCDNSASAEFFCGDALIQLGRHGKAVKHLAHLVERDPGLELMAPALLRLGDALVALQKWARAERVFVQYLERFSDRPQAFQARFGVGWCREHQQRYDEAIAAYREVTRGQHAGPTAARAQFQIGEVLFAQKKLEDAARELLKVDILYAYPEWSAAALFEAGRCLEGIGRRVEAVKQFKTVVDKHGDTKWARLASQRLSEVSAVSLPGRGTD